MKYEVVYDLATVGFVAWKPLAIGMILIITGIVAYVWRAAFSKLLWPIRSQRVAGFGAAAFLLAAIVWTSLITVHLQRHKAELLGAIANGSVRVTEGVVSDFSPMPASGHENERFCLRDTCFEYSDYEISGGFNNSSVMGGPIREGLSIRVWDVAGVIVRLEVKK
jgi:hypothetical protein